MAYPYIYSRFTIEDSVASQENKVIPLANGKVFILWRPVSPNVARGQVGYFTNNSFEMGTPQTIVSTQVSHIDACLVDTDTIVITYKDGADSNRLKARVITITDTDMSIGAAQTLVSTTSAGSDTVAVCSPSTNKICAIYERDNVVYMVAATLSSGTLTAGSEITALTGSQYIRLAIEKASDDKVVYIYDDTINEKYYAEARTLTGTTVNAAGTALDLLEAEATSPFPSLARYADDQLYAHLYGSSDGTQAQSGSYLLRISASGTTLTREQQTLIHQYYNGTNPEAVAITVLDSEKMLLAYADDELEVQLVQLVDITSFSVYTLREAVKYSDFLPSVPSTKRSLAINGLGNLFLILYSEDDSTDRTMLAFGSATSIQAVDNKRSIVSSSLVSWKKDFRADIILFTIGVSSIGGNDLIAPTEQIDSQWNKYLYFDESNYLKYLEYEHGLQLPIGGIRVGLAEGEFENTSGRFTPRYMGGNSELFTSILPRRPFILNAGFEDQGVEYTYPQFVGLFSRQPEVSLRDKYLRWVGKDFVDFLSNRFVDDEAIYTGYRSDQLIEQILGSLGFTTGQYDLDQGLNTIPFAIFRRGDKFGDLIDTISKAEYANFYQDEEGILRFENRHHWNSSPHNEVQWDFVTSQVLEAELPNDDHIINVVEVKADVRQKQPAQTIFTLNTFDSIQVSGNSTEEVFVDFTDPVLAITTPTNGGTLSFYKGNTLPDGTGSDVTSSLTITKQYLFSNAAKFTFSNSNASTVYITELVVSGRPAKIEKTIYYRTQDDSSVTAYEERPYLIENDYIQTEDWASTLSQLLLIDFATPEKLQTLTIRAIPQLKLGDLVSWQGKMWRVFEKSSVINAATGFVQEVKLLQRDIQTFFRIGISTVGSSDKIAP